MRPILFGFPFFELSSYYVFWGAALLVFLFLSFSRCERFGLSREAARSALLCCYIGAIAGGLAASAVEKIPLILSGKESFEILRTGGLSSGGGFLVGGMAAILSLRKNKASLFDFGEATAVPAAVMLAIGRIGCFLEGCCVGFGVRAAERPFWGVHFPADPAGFYRLPSQLCEAFAALIIAVILTFMEKKQGGKRLLFGFFLLLYGIYRFVFDFFRPLAPHTSFRSGHVFSVLAIAVGIVWLYSANKRGFRAR